MERSRELEDLVVVWSAVFHNEDGVWRFVQTHASIAVPNDQIGWVYRN